jgi:tetratricopeptide (TPR) repeat protein
MTTENEGMTMWQRTSLVVTFVLVAAMAGAQTLPAPPRPPAPPKAPALPAAPVIAPDLEMRLEGLTGLKDLESSAMAMALDATSMSLAALGRGFDSIDMADLQDLAIAKGQAFAFSSESADYDRGTSYLDSGRYDRAVEAFDKVIAKNGKKADGATYWKAYALNRLGKRDESIRTIEELQKKFPSSRWANDAKALLIDVRQASGQPISPENAGDEELKLIALNGIMMRDPERAIPMVEQLLTTSASPKLKQRGLFVLAQSASPRAKALLAEVAKGKGNPDLQLKALDYLGVFGGGPDVQLLVDVYRSTNDIDVKKRVIRSLAMTGRRGVAFNFSFGDVPAIYGQAMDEARTALDSARTEVERTRAQAEIERERARVEVERDRAVAGGRTTGQASATASARASASPSPVRSAAAAERDRAREAKAKEAGDALWQLYQGESSVELKREILRNMRFSAQADRLLQIARTDSNTELRQAAVQGLLRGDRTPKTAEMMLGLYRAEKDPAVRRQIVDSLSMTGSAATLVQMARQEADPQLRKRIVERLSMMKDKEAVDYMMEILKK